MTPIEQNYELKLPKNIQLIREFYWKERGNKDE